MIIIKVWIDIRIPVRLVLPRKIRPTIISRSFNDINFVHSLGPHFAFDIRIRSYFTPKQPVCIRFVNEDLIGISSTHHIDFGTPTDSIREKIPLRYCIRAIGVHSYPEDFSPEIICIGRSSFSTLIGIAFIQRSVCRVIGIVSDSYKEISFCVEIHIACSMVVSVPVTIPFNDYNFGC